jgi:hypothetical protein
MIAKEMSLPWRAVESMHWQMGAEEMAQRANVAVFQSHVPALTTVKPALSSASTTGTTRRLSPKSPTQSGAVSDHSSTGGHNQGGVLLSNPSIEPLSGSSTGPITRGRRDETEGESGERPSWDRKRNDSKVMERIEGEVHYRKSASEERDSPGGVPLDMEAEHEDEREERERSDDPPKTRIRGSWEREREDAAVSDQTRSRSPASVLSGVQQPSSINFKPDRE